MMTITRPRLAAISTAFAGLLILGACVLSPGKFTSSLDIRADRSFTFAYKGEVILTDFSDISKGLGDSSSEDSDSSPDTGIGAEDAPVLEGEETGLYRQIALADDQPAADVPGGNAIADNGEIKPEDESKRKKMQDIADALMKEEGYRSVRYMGNNRFDVDYLLSGKLDHSFVFPFNVDAQAAFPFLVIEVRKDGKIRMQAPGFAENSESKSAAGGMGKGSPEREGSFTLTTNAEIVSQNQEDGAVTVPTGKQIVWKITPTTAIAPMAVLKLAPRK